MANVVILGEPQRSCGEGRGSIRRASARQKIYFAPQTRRGWVPFPRADALAGHDTDDYATARFRE